MEERESKRRQTMTQKLKLYFLGYFLYFSCSFLIIYFIWMNIVKSVQMGEVMSNCTSTIAVSITFLLVYGLSC